MSHDVARRLPAGGLLPDLSRNGDHDPVTISQHGPPAHSPDPSPDDAAISKAVEQLLENRRESVVDLAHFTRISVASLYRKLAGAQSWKAADVGRVARHYQVDPGALFSGAAASPAPAPVVAGVAGVDPLRQPFGN